MVEHPDQIERWDLKRDSLPTPAEIVNIATGPNQERLVTQFFPLANRNLKRSIVALAGLPGTPYPMGLALGLHPSIGDDNTATMLRQGKPLAEALAFSAPDPALVQAMFKHIDQRYGTKRARILCCKLGTPEGLTDSFLRDLALDDHIPQPLLDYLAHSSKGLLRKFVALNRSLPPDLLVKLSTDPDPSVRAYIALRWELAPKFLQTLATDPDDEVRTRVARNHATPLETIHSLSQDPIEHVRCSAAQNESATPEMLRTWSTDNSATIRAAVARNTSTPPDVLPTLATDPDQAVRASCGFNPNTPLPLLEQLAVDPEPDIRAEVARNVEVPTPLLLKLAQDPSREVRGRLTWNPALPLPVINVLLQDSSWMVLSGIARNHRTPGPALTALAHLDGEGRALVQPSVAGNPSTPIETLRELMQSETEYVGQLAARNPAIPLTEAVAWLTKSKDPDARLWAAHRTAVHGLSLTHAPLHPGVHHINQVLMIALRAQFTPEVPWPATPRTIDDLPGFEALPWVIDPTVLALEGSVLHFSQSPSLATTNSSGQDLHISVIGSSQQLCQNAQYMGNCTASYGDSCAEGTSVILALTNSAGDTQYNAELVKLPDGWHVGEVNSRFNQGGVPSWLTLELAALAQRLNSAPPLSDRPPCS